GDEDASFPVEYLARRALRPIRPELAAVGKLARHQADTPIRADQVVLADVALARVGDLPGDLLSLEVEAAVDAFVAREQLPPVGPHDEAVRRVEEGVPAVALVLMSLAAEQDLARGGIEDGQAAIRLDEGELARER